MSVNLGPETEAETARELAETARRLAQLMHQPRFKRELLAEANRLDRRAAILERPDKRAGHLSVVVEP
jgi:hypothetical protein